LSSFIVSLAVCCLANGQADLPNPAKFVNKPMPAFDMVKFGGGRITNTNLRGKVYIVDFWGTWCVTCRQMTPILEELYAKYRKEGLKIVGADAGEFSPKAIQRELKFHPRPYTVTLDNDAYAEHVDAVAFPTVFVVDRRGVVRDVEVGIPRNPKNFEATVRKLLADKN
jgi:thiol-disulfide isomerase/thioredoxin